MLKKISRALISVSDKTGIVEFAQKLNQHNIEIISTGGTSKTLREHGLNVRDISDVTGFPEMLDGRVKTLHPKVHGGILGIRDNSEHRAKMNEHDIEPIDMVVVNLYPFHATIQKPNVKIEDAIENIDIGGPAMIRSAAKNHNDVGVVVDPNDYRHIIEQLDAQGGALSFDDRFKLAVTAFEHTAAYDAEIARYLGSKTKSATSELSSELPDTIDLHLGKITGLRYGENPHQRAALYKLTDDVDGIARAEQIQGKELSYNNLMDSDAAWELVMEIDRLQFNDAMNTCAIIKHANPCGIGRATTALEAFSKAKSTDPISAFGGIIAFSNKIDGPAAQAISEMFAEVIIAPDYSDDALEFFKTKKNLRVLRMKKDDKPMAHLEFRKISGGMLIQDRDAELMNEEKFEIVTNRKPTTSELRTLRFAWAICKHVKSNAIVYASDNQLVGVGAGQMSRVDSARFGVIKAQLPIAGSVLASDAFFPFRDGVDEAAKAGVTSIIQPGGSVRDKEVIDAANEHNIAMVFTGMRHFKH